MHFKAASIALAASLTAVAAQSCHDYVIVSVRGTYEIQGPSIAFPGMINATLAAVPNGIEYDAVYPAAANQTYYLGSDDVVRYINAGLASCPQQKYALLGYSQGASALMLALTNYTDPTSAGYKAIKAVLVVGNPYHRPNETVDVDQFDGDTTRVYPGVLYNADDPNSHGIPDIYYTNNELIDICYQEDSICAPAYPNATFVPGHLHYGDQVVQDLGASFLIPRLSSNGTVKTNSTTAASTGILPTGTAVSTGGYFPSGTGSASKSPTGTASASASVSLTPSSYTGVAPSTMATSVSKSQAYPVRPTCMFTLLSSVLIVSGVGLMMVS